MVIYSKIKNILKCFIPACKRDKFPADMATVKEYLKKEDYKAALKLLNKHIKNNKLNSEAYYLRHFCYLNLNDYDNYIKDLQQSCQLFQYENNTDMYKKCIKELAEWNHKN